MSDTRYHFEAVGQIHSPFKEKFAIPRQPGLVSAAQSYITLSRACNREEILRGLEGFSHLWLVFVFHQAIKENWKPTVRPPRLGGNKKIGVFASRSPFRPNPIGLSAVTLKGIEQVKSQWRIHIGGADLLDGTPILDIKPYLPYVDAIPEACGHYAQESPDTVSEIVFSDLARQQLQQYSQLRNSQLQNSQLQNSKLQVSKLQVSKLQDLKLQASKLQYSKLQEKHYPQLEELIRQVLAQQPQPAYQTEPRNYGMCLYDLNIRWHWQDGCCEVIGIESVPPEN